MFKPTVDIVSKTSSSQAEKIFRILNFSIPLFMGIYLFANPLPLSAVSEFCFYLSLLILIILIAFKKTVFTLRSPLTLPFILFFLWAVFGLFFTLDFKNTLHDLRGHLLELSDCFLFISQLFQFTKEA